VVAHQLQETCIRAVLVSDHGTCMPAASAEVTGKIMHESNAFQKMWSPRRDLNARSPDILIRVSIPLTYKSGAVSTCNIRHSVIRTPCYSRPLCYWGTNRRSSRMHYRVFALGQAKIAETIPVNTATYLSWYTLSIMIAYASSVSLSASRSSRWMT